jgi:hypothetical protein
MEWLVKKSQVLGEIGKHHSVIGLGKALLNPCLDDGTECEIWAALWSRWFPCSLASLHFLLFLEDEDRKMKDCKTQFLVSFMLSNDCISPVFCNGALSIITS